jgi:putative aldouronate transport system permease protein
VSGRPNAEIILKKRHSKRILTRDVVSFNVFGYILLILFALMCITPFYLVVISSFQSENVLIRSGYAFYIKEFSLESYRLCLKNPDSILKAYGMTISVTSIGTLCAVLLSTMTGYVLSRKDFKARNFFSFFFFFTTLFSGGLVPWYIICVRYLNIKNTVYAMILPLMFSVWNMIIAKSFMSGLPSAITESAKIDGANDMTIFLRLILPLSTPLIATLGLFSALAYWNDWYNCMLFVTKDDMYTLQYYLQNMLNNADALKRAAAMSNGSITVSTSVPLEGMKMAMTVIATGPIVLLYPFVQRYFVKGLTIGAVKG